MAENSELMAMIDLLQDDDPMVLEAVRKAFLAKGAAVVPELEKAWELSMSEKLQERIENLVHELHFDWLKQHLRTWLDEGSHNLLQGALLVASYGYPNLDRALVSAEIERITRQAIDELPPEATPLEKIRALNHVFFELNGFSQNSQNFYAPGNSFLNIVLEQRKGNPISLSILYMLVAQRIGLPVYGVNLPKIFILVFQDLAHPDLNSRESVLFYINPYNRGAVLSAKEIEFFARQQRLAQRNEFFLPCSTPVIVRRLFQNLSLAYKQADQMEKHLELEELLAVLDNYLSNTSALLH